MKKENNKKNIGINVQIPVKDCKDLKCPFHGSVKVHGRILVGEVISDKADKTVTIKWELRKFIKKYERYAIKTKKIKAHNPACINAKTGDIVTIMETRPLSKTKNFVVIEIQNTLKKQNN
ncbi:MAG: 30S ribosomal protein S17 [Candidatus Woesearchaeota archaeon]